MTIDYHHHQQYHQHSHGYHNHHHHCHYQYMVVHLIRHVCMYIYMRVYDFVYVHRCVYMCSYLLIYVHIFVYKYTCTKICKCFKYTRIHINTKQCGRISKNIMCIYVYAYIYIYILHINRYTPRPTARNLQQKAPPRDPMNSLFVSLPKLRLFSPRHLVIILNMWRKKKKMAS